MIHNNMTVGYLLKFIEENNIPDDAIIYTERIHDIYFEPGKGWDEKSVRKEGGYWYQYYTNTIKKIKEGEYDDKESYPDITEEWKQKFLELEKSEDLEKLKNQYVAIWCPVKYRDDNNLYLDLHS